jgi:hypothetical protein
MKIRIAVGAGLLLTLGTAMAGTLIYGGQGRSASMHNGEASTPVTAVARVTPEMLAMWRAQAGSDDYISPKVPL